MGIADGKTPVDEGRSLTPSSHAARSVNARIQAGPVWMEIVRSDHLPEPTLNDSFVRRLVAWRRTVPTSRLIAVGALAAAAITGFSLASSPYRWPTLPQPVGINAITRIVEPDPNGGGDPTVGPTADSSSNGSVPSAATVSKAKSAPPSSSTAAASTNSAQINSAKLTSAPSATPTPTPPMTSASSAPTTDQSTTSSPTDTTTSASTTDTSTDTTTITPAAIPAP